MVDLIEGPLMTDNDEDKDALNQLKTQVNALVGPDRAKFAEMVEVSKIAGRSFAASETPSLRRFAIAGGILLLLEDEQFDRELITAICRFVTGKQYKKAGEALADLDWQQAASFCECCRLLTQDGFDLSYDIKTNQFQLHKLHRSSHE